MASGSATYTGGSGSETLDFSYTVQPGDNTGDLQVTELNLNGGSITDASSNALSLSNDTKDTGIQIDTTAPTATPASLTVAENSAATAIGIVAPTDNFTLPADPISVTALPNDGTVLLSDGSTAVTVNESLSVAQLTGLEFQPTANLFGTSSSFGYTVTDGAGNSAQGSATLAIGAQSAPPTISSITPSPPSGNDLKAGEAVTFTVDVSEDVTVNIAGGTPSLALSNGASAIYNGGTGGTALTFLYSVQQGDANTGDLQVTGLNLNGGSITDASSNALSLSNDTKDTGIAIDTTNPTTTPASLTVAENSAPTAIGIVAPTDNFALPADPITVTALPNDGTVLLSDGSTAVTANESLSVAQLTGLEFRPTANLFGTSSSFGYTVTDGAENSQAGTATLTIQTPTPTPPSISSIVSTPASGSDLDAGKTVSFTVDVSEAVTVSGNPLLMLSNNLSAVYSGGTGTDAINFSYTVQQGDTSNDLSVIGLNLNGGSITDASSNALSLSNDTEDTGIVVDTTNPTTTPKSLTVAENGAATAIGIVAPTDNFALPADPITVTALPNDGTVLLSDGSTAVTVNESLSVAQLTGLEFQPTANLYGTSSSFGYAVTDGAENSTPGSATLAIGAQSAPPTISAVPTISVAEGQAIAASSLVASISNPRGDKITPTILVFDDEGGGSGYFTVNGAPQPDGQWFYPLATDNVQYVGGSSPGTDALEVGLYDYTTNSYYVSNTTVSATTLVPPPTPSALTFAVAVDRGSLGNTMTLSGIGKSLDTIDISDDGSQIGSTIVQSDGSWSFTSPNPLALGTHSLTLSDSNGSMTSAPSTAQVLAIQNGTPNSVVFFGASGGASLVGGPGQDIFEFTATGLSASDFITGGAGLDWLWFTTPGTIASSAFANLQGVDVIHLADGANNIAIPDALVAGSDADKLTVQGGSADTIDASEVAAGRTLVLNGTPGQDIFEFAASGLSASDFITGGAGLDWLWFTTPGTVASSAFANVHGIDVVHLADGANNIAIPDALVAGSDADRLTVQGGSADTIDASSVAAGRTLVLHGTPGQDIFEFAASGLSASDFITAGAGLDWLWFTTPGTVAASAFANVQGVDVIHLANGVNNITLNDTMVAESDANKLTINGGTGADTVNASALAAAETIVFNGDGGADAITGGRGDNYYNFNNVAGQTFNVTNAFTGGTAAHGQLDFGPGITDEKLWFEESGTNLVADVIGTDEQVTIENWFGANESAQLSEIEAGGLKLDSQLQQLVNAMTTFATDNPTTFNPFTATAMPNDTTLQNAIAGAWHH